jgi:hypothetical protein
LAEQALFVSISEITGIHAPVLRSQWSEASAYEFMMKVSEWLAERGYEASPVPPQLKAAMFGPRRLIPVHSSKETESADHL